MDIEEKLMEEFKKVLEKHKEITNITSYVNLEFSHVLKYDYEGQSYVLSTDILE